MEHEPKISLEEIVIITPYLLLLDGLGILLVAVGMDDFFILDAVRFPVTQLYMRFKGVKGTSMLIGNILELIPYVGGLPISTVAWLITIYLDRHPEKAEILSALGGIKEKKWRSYQHRALKQRKAGRTTSPDSVNSSASEGISPMPELDEE